MKKTPWACGFFSASVLACSAAYPVDAQEPVERAFARFDRQMVSIMERALTQHTERTTTVLYLRRVSGDATTGVYCGQALFGSARDRFIIRMTDNDVVWAPPASAWRAASCDTPLANQHTLIDVR